ncbi:MAG: MFS transporter [Synergistaceae bacterium]|nr:MFS transporter [Synergistaceae bacterium]
MIFPKPLRALNSRNYRLFFAAQTVSMTGLWMHRVAIGWLVFRLTDSNSALGLMDFTASLPICLLSPLAGAVIERLDLRKALFYMQAGCMCIAFALAFCTLTELITFKLVLLLVVSRGVIDAFELPTRYSLVNYMVDKKEDVANAVALNSTLFNTARMIGPTIGGFVIHALGESFCFFSNGFCYLSTMWALRRMKMKRAPVGKSGGELHPLLETWAGINMARNFAPDRYLLTLITLTGFFCFPSIILMPAMARSVLQGSSRTLGVLLMGIAVGALAGSILMATRKSTASYSWWCTRSCLCFGLSVMIFSLSRNIWLSIILAAPVGFCMVVCTIACNTLLQTMNGDESRSRIMALYTLAIVGVPPFGSLLAGRLGDLVGTAWALFICGICSTLAAFYYMKKIDKISFRLLMALKRRGAL